MSKTLRFEGWESWLVAAWALVLGINAGAGLYEARIVVPQWLVPLPSGGYVWRAEVAAEMNVGLRFWAFVSTGPLTLLLLLNLWRAARSDRTVRSPWLASVCVALTERALTFTYFIPTMLRLFDVHLAQEQAVASAHTWARLNHARHALVLLALGFALVTLYRLGASAGRRRARSATP